MEFEVGGLDLTPFLSGPLHSEDSRPIFDMYGCVCHFGCVYGGHYTAFSRHLGTDQWNHFNDNCIQESKVPGESEGDNGSAYILFYQRAGKMLFHSLLYYVRILPKYYQSWTTAVDRWVDTSNCGQEINDFMTVVKSKWPNFTQSAYVIKSLCSRGLLLKNLSCLPRYTETFNLSSLALLIYEASQFKKKVLLLKKSIVCRI